MAKMKRYGLTAWGGHFYEELESLFEADPRLARGKTYFNKGSVKSLAIDEGEVITSVKGSSRSTYKNVLTFKPFSDETKSKIVTKIGSDPFVQSALLNGVLPEEFIEWCDTEEIKLFLKGSLDLRDPYHRILNNFDAHCNCADWAVPCKHTFAALLALNAEIDHNPLLLFSLRGLDLSDLLDAFGEDANMYPIALAPWEERVCEKPLEILHHENALGLIDSLLSEHPSFAPIDYKEVMREFYKAHAKALPQIISPVFDENIEIIERLLKDSSCECNMDELWKTGNITIKHPLFRQEVKTQGLFAPYALKYYQGGCSVSLLSFITLFLSFRSEEGKAAYRYYHALARAFYLLLHANAFIPTVLKDSQRPRFFIGWMPLLTPSSVSEQIERLACNATPFVRFLKSDPFFDGRSGTLLFLSKAMTEYVHEINFMHKRLFMNPPAISESFFKGRPFVQKEGGKHNLDRAVFNYFSIFSLPLSRYALTLTLDRGDEEENYSLSMSIYDAQSLKEQLLCDALAEENSGGLLKLLSPIRGFLSEIESLSREQRIELHPQKFEQFILESSHLLSSFGVKIVLPRELQHLIKPRLSMRIRTKSTPTSFLTLDKVLEYDWTIAIGDTHISLEEFQALVSQQGELVLFRDSYISISPEELKALFAQAKKTPKLSRFDMLRARFDGSALFEGDLETFFETLFRPQDMRLSANLNATLRPYQERGVQWCVSNLLSGFGVILADDMGLGKTIQTIATLLHLYEENHIKGRTLIVVPTSLLANWENELAQFAPSLSVSLYYGLGRQLSDTKIIVTTYDIFRRDEKVFASHKIEALVIDEAQRIKNPTTQAAIALKSFKAKYRIALSGTPVENSLTELWSIFDFTMSGYLSELNTFIKSYVRPIEIDQNQEAANSLKLVTAPFMLRRLKTDKSIIDDLPDKIVIDEYATLIPEQAALYQSVVNGAMKGLEEQTEPQRRSGLIFKLITELKQICNHPRNYDKTSPYDAALSGKSELLLTLLEPMIAKGEKVLIFTQYVEMLNILAHIIEEKFFVEPLTFDGSLSSKQREEVVSSFQNDPEKQVLILSLKAGGVGLNLTQAANVIHYDLWFNPAVENQATDRAFRIGQKNNVFVYRFITKNSFEEKIDKMIKAKTAMGEMSVSVGEKAIATMENEEIRALFVRG
ncbi:MAG: SNF2-related protein [Sulfuricurvum sp.]